MLKVTILCGNPRKRSRTLEIAESLIGKLLVGGSYDQTVIDLAAHSDQLFANTSDTIAEFVDSVCDCELLVVASPTYKATYTGLLKVFLDRLPADGLKDVLAIPVMTGGDLAHSMGPEVNLRPLLVELGASIPSRGLYFVTSDMDELAHKLQVWVAANSNSLRRLSSLADSIVPAEPTPAPI